MAKGRRRKVGRKHRGKGKLVPARMHGKSLRKKGGRKRR